MSKWFEYVPQPYKTKKDWDTHTAIIIIQLIVVVAIITVFKIDIKNITTFLILLFIGNAVMLSLAVIETWRWKKQEKEKLK